MKIPADLPKPKHYTPKTYVATNMPKYTPPAGRKSFIGVNLTGGNAGIIYKNSQGQSLHYSKRLTTGWGVNYLLNTGPFLLEAGVGYAKIESKHIEPGLNTNVSVDLIRTTVVGSFAALQKKSIQILLGGGFSVGHMLSGVQQTNDIETDLIVNNVYKKNETALVGDIGLLFKTLNKTMMRVSYQYRKGLTNMEKDANQSTKTISYGIQAAFYFDF